jgi:hypothetical protein
VGEGEQDFQVPLPFGEGFRVRADTGDIFPVKSLNQKYTEIFCKICNDICCDTSYLDD